MQPLRHKWNISSNQVEGILRKAADKQVATCSCGCLRSSSASSSDAWLASRNTRMVAHGARRMVVHEFEGPASGMVMTR
jgi:hypothetical protein